ncbi:unnamed protein product, partial [Ectocarpus sp. 12 AP-2014]
RGSRSWPVEAFCVFNRPRLTNSHRSADYRGRCTALKHMRDYRLRREQRRTRTPSRRIDNLPGRRGDHNDWGMGMRVGSTLLFVLPPPQNFLFSHQHASTRKRPQTATTHRTAFDISGNRDTTKRVREEAKTIDATRAQLAIVHRHDKTCTSDTTPPSVPVY